MGFGRLKHKTHLFFDLDDTLWDFEKNSSAVLEELFFEFALGEKLQTDLQFFLTAYNIKNRELWTKYYRKEIDKPFLRNHRFNEVFRQFNYNNYNENLVITEQYLARAPKGRHLKDGCKEALDYLQENYNLHIITNGFKETQDIKLDSCELRPYFSHIIISEEHDCIKPDEKIFRLAEHLAQTERQHCVMIGDNLESDISGALNAGWEAVYFSNSKPQNFRGNFIANLEELKKMF